MQKHVNIVSSSSSDESDADSDVSDEEVEFKPAPRTRRRKSTCLQYKKIIFYIFFKENIFLVVNIFL